MTVYVIQNALQKNRRTGELEPKFDYSPAEQFGSLEFLLPHAVKPFDPSRFLPELRKKLDKFSDEDYLLLTGNPAIMATAFAIAADRNEGNVNVLQYNGMEHRYVPIFVENVFGDEDPDLQ